MAQDFGTDGGGDFAGVGQVLLITGNVQIGFVQRERLDQIGVLPEHGMNLLRHFAIQMKTRRHKHGLRAQPPRSGGGHGRMQPETPRFIRSGAHHRTAALPSHHQRLATQMRLLAQLYRGVERVHIDVDDFSFGRHGGAEGGKNARIIVD